MARRPASGAAAGEWSQASGAAAGEWSQASGAAAGEWRGGRRVVPGEGLFHPGEPTVTWRSVRSPELVGTMPWGETMRPK